MQRWIQKSSWKLVSIMVVMMQTGTAWSQEHMQREFPIPEKVALVQHDEVIGFSRHNLDASIRDISRPDDSFIVNRHPDESGDVLNPDNINPVMEQDSFSKESSETDSNLVDEELANVGIVTRTNKVRRKINPKGVKMLRRMLWMSLFYTGSK